MLAWITVLPNNTFAQTDRAEPRSDTNELGNWSQTLTWSKLLDTIKNKLITIYWKYYFKYHSRGLLYILI